MLRRLRRKEINLAKKRGSPPQTGYGGNNEGGGAQPPNPSDAIMMGAPLPMIRAEASVLRRSFTDPIRPPLHYTDGSGPDEVVTSRRPVPPKQLGSTESDRDHTDQDADSFGPQSRSGGRGRDGADSDKTTNGTPIYGT